MTATAVGNALQSVDSKIFGPLTIDILSEMRRKAKYIGFSGEKQRTLPKSVEKFHPKIVRVLQLYTFRLRIGCVPCSSRFGYKKSSFEFEVSLEVLRIYLIRN